MSDQVRALVQAGTIRADAIKPGQKIRVGGVEWVAKTVKPDPKNPGRILIGLLGQGEIGMSSSRRGEVVG